MAAEETSFPGVDTGNVSSETLSDAELIAATRAGDASSFAVLYTRHVDAAQACARRLVRSRSEADDLVAEGFAKVLGALRKGKGPDLAFRPYLLTAVRNALYDRTRRDSRVEFTDEPPEPVNAVLLGADYEREDRAMVAQAYAALPERWQMVLWHTDVEGRQPAEIAPLLGISANSVAALAYRAREGLRQAYLNAHVNRGGNEDCRGTTEKLSAYVRDGLSARDRRAVQEHLDRCTPCTALLAELQEANRSLKVVLIPVLAGVSASAYLSGLGGGGITRLVRRNPTATAAGAVAAAAALVFTAAALRSPGDDGTAQALTVPPVGSGRPTTTTTTLPPTTTRGPSTTPATTPTTVYVPPTFDTLVPPITNVPFNPNATTVTTVRRPTTTTRPPATTRPTTTTSTTTTTTTQPGNTATTTTTTTTTTLPPNTQAPPAPPALLSAVSGLGPVYSGQNAYFSVKVENAASGNGGSARKVAVGPAEGVVVTFNLPPGASFTGASSPDWQCDVVGSSVRCLLPRLEAGAKTEAVFSLDVAAGTTPGTNFTISPTVMVNGQRIDAKPTTRAVEDGANIADFIVARGAQLVVTGNSAVTCAAVPVPSNDNCDDGAKQLVSPSAAAIDLGGRSVIHAHLVWQGSGSPDGEVRLAAPGRDPSALAGTLIRENQGGYSATADVTDIVRAAGNGTYSVTDLASGAASSDFAGWALVVIVEDPAGPLRGVAVNTSVQMLTGNSGAIGFKGLQPLDRPRGVDVAVLVGEGDPAGNNITGERMWLTDVAAPEGVVALATELHKDDGNFFRSAVIGQPTVNAYGTDVDLFHAQQSGAATSVEVQAKTGPDKVWISAVAVAFDL